MARQPDTHNPAHNTQVGDPKVHPELRPENQPRNRAEPVPVSAVGDPSTLSGAPNTPPTVAQVAEEKSRLEAEREHRPAETAPQGATPEPVPLAHATRAASVAHPSAPESPTVALEDKSEHAVKERERQRDATDARLVLAHDLAKRGLAYASVNDLAKAVLLMLDVHHTAEPGKSDIGKAADRGEPPALL